MSLFHKSKPMPNDQATQRWLDLRLGAYPPHKPGGINISSGRRNIVARIANWPLKMQERKDWVEVMVGRPNIQLPREIKHIKEKHNPDNWHLDEEGNRVWG